MIQSNGDFFDKNNNYFRCKHNYEDIDPMQRRICKNKKLSGSENIEYSCSEGEKSDCRVAAINEYYRLKDQLNKKISIETLEKMVTNGNSNLGFDCFKKAYQAFSYVLLINKNHKEAKKGLENTKNELIKKKPRYALDVFIEHDVIGSPIDYDGLEKLGKATLNTKPELAYCAFFETGDEEGLKEVENKMHEIPEVQKESFNDVLKKIKQAEDENIRISGLDIIRFYESFLTLRSMKQSK